MAVRVRNVLQAASNSFERTPHAVCCPHPPFTSSLTLAKQSDEDTSDGLDGQDAKNALFPSTAGEAVPGGEQTPAQGRPPRSSDPDLYAVREGARDLSDRVFINKTTGGLVCPPCKVHGELGRFGGLSAWSCSIPMHVCMRACVSTCLCSAFVSNCELATVT